MKRESLRYLQNAKNILKNIPVEDAFYTDIKPEREALKSTKAFTEKIR